MWIQNNFFFEVGGCKNLNDFQNALILCNLLFLCNMMLFNFSEVVVAWTSH